MADILKIQGLNVSYGAIRALRDVDITVKEGSITAILGSNGGGKSTLLKTISGLVKPESGSIDYLGHSINKLAAEKITKNGIIHVPEGRQIFGDLTVYENLMIGAFTVKKADIPIESIEESIIDHPLKDKIKVAQDAGLTTVTLSRKEIIKNNLTKVYSYFPVLKERKEQVAQSLSGGEQQMLAIGRGLMGTPKLLVLDEPSLGLAPLIVKNIFEILKRLNQEGISILIVEQNALQTLKIANYAYVIQVGKIIKHGRSSSLINDPELIEAYLGK